MLRIILFVATNLAVMLVMSVVMKLFGVEQMLMQQGLGINLTGLLIMAGVMGMTGSLFSLLTSKWMAKQAVGAYVIETPANSTEQWLLDTVRRLATQAGIGMPEVAMFDSPDVNAFATGYNRNDALVAVSTGLLRSMRQDEVEAVLGHEISHVANGDMVTLALIQGVVNTFVIFLARVIGMLVDRGLSRSDEGSSSYGYGPGYWLTSMILEMVFGVLASIIVMWFSRWREFRADAGGAHLAGRGKMIAALQRLQQAHEAEHMPQQIAAFGINSSSGFARLFMSHPPLEERIAALRNAD
jgi:heat shock protein HtpX